MQYSFPLYKLSCAFRQLVGVGAMVICVACSPKINARGHVDAQKNMEKIQVGRSYRQDVMQMLGSPSTTSTFGEERWYYITAQKEAFGFLAPEVTKQDVTQITFNEDGMVTDIQRRGIKDRRDIEITQETTPTEGHQLGFFEQLLGNVGRFNKPPQEAR
jgi:outer membrane protein assembly factor BamE (lipoprotein component of BamABCDE complex)